jgi:beta-glucosidase
MAAWPAGFIWGTAASSTQCEGAAPASDWIEWERAGRAPCSGEGNGFATRYREDFALYADAGLRHHRLSLEWARLEPEAGRHDAAEVARYRAILSAARELGIEPWVCLHHFTLPRWFAAQGGFRSAECRRGAWRRHVAFVAETFGDLVGGWKPVNEPVAYAAAGWLGNGFPPGENGFEAFGAVLENVLLASFEAAGLLRQTGAPVASIFNLSGVHGVGAGAEPVAAVFDAALWGSWLGVVREGVLRVAGREPVACSELAGVFDLVGFSYYSALGVRADGTLVPYPEGAPVSPLGYGIWPQGLREVLDRLHAELPGRPLLVCELGLGTGADEERCRYLSEGLEIVRGALADGVDLRGLFHWTGVDNYEWLHGYDVSFGCIDGDRRPRGSHELLATATGARQTGAG